MKKSIFILIFLFSISAFGQKEIIITLGSGSGNNSLANFYLKDSSLSSDRTVDMNGKILRFERSKTIFDSIGIIPSTYIADSIAFFGTSWTRGWPGPIDSAGRWTLLVSNRVNAKEANYGVNGATLVTTGIANLALLPTYNASKYRWIVNEWGINEIWPNTQDTATFATAYKRYVDTLLARGWPAQKIILLTPFCIYQQSGQDARQLSFGTAVKSVAAIKGTKVIDIQAAFLRTGSRQLIISDSLHPNDWGQSILSDMIVNVLGDSVKAQGQQMAINGTAEFQNIILDKADTANNYKLVPLGIDSLNRIFRFNKNALVYNGLYQPAGTVQPGGLNMQSAYITSATLGYGAVTLTSPVYTTGEGLYFNYDAATGGYVFAHNYGTITQKPLILNGQGAQGNVIVGSGAINLPDLFAVPTGGMKALYGRFNGSPSVAGTGLNLEMGVFSGHAYLVGADRTAGTWKEVNIGNIGSPTTALTVGATTITGTTLMQVNGSSYTSGNAGFGNSAPNSAIQTTSFSSAYVAKTANYTATASDYTINFTSGTDTLTLPTAVGITGRIYVIKNSGAGTITIATTSSELIDGTSTQTLSTQYSSYTLQSTGSAWIIL